MSDYEVRFYHPGEEEKIVDLLSLAFTEWKARKSSALDHWRWMYQDNPFGPCNVAVVIYNNQIVGVSHDLHFYTKIGNIIEKTVYGTDAAVHPEHRRRGLYNRMQELRFSHRQDYKLQYCYTTNKILIEQNIRKLKEGDDPEFLFPIEINRYLTIQDIDLHLNHKKTDNAWIKKQGYKIKKLTSNISISKSKLKTIKHTFDIDETRNFNEADQFWEKIKSKYKFIVTKNKEYLDWRFLDHRSGDYHIFTAHNDHEYCGYIVISIDYETPGYPVGNIIDLVYNGDMIIGEMLVRRASAWLNDLKINAISAFAVKGSKISHALESTGFINRGDPLYATYRIPGKSGVTHPEIESLDVNQAHFMYSDFYVK